MISIYIYGSLSIYIYISVCGCVFLFFWGGAGEQVNQRVELRNAAQTLWPTFSGTSCKGPARSQEGHFLSGLESSSAEMPLTAIQRIHVNWITNCISFGELGLGYYIIVRLCSFQVSMVLQQRTMPSGKSHICMRRSLLSLSLPLSLSLYICVMGDSRGHLQEVQVRGCVGHDNDSSHIYAHPLRAAW